MSRHNRTVPDRTGQKDTTVASSSLSSNIVDVLHIHGRIVLMDSIASIDLDQLQFSERADGHRI